MQTFFPDFNFAGIVQQLKREGRKEMLLLRVVVTSLESNSILQGLKCGLPFHAFLPSLGYFILVLSFQVAGPVLGDGFGTHILLQLSLFCLQL